MIHELFGVSTEFLIGAFMFVVAPATLLVYLCVNSWQNRRTQKWIVWRLGGFADPARQADQEAKVIDLASRRRAR